jgi:hypothetical protein
MDREQLIPGEGGRESFASPYAQMMDEQRAELRPEGMPRARDLGILPKGKFRFRTKPEAGRKRFEIPLLIPHVGKDDALYDDAMQRYRRWAERQKRQNDSDPQHIRGIPAEEFVKSTMMLKRDQAVFQEIHDYKIKFHPVRRSRECVYTTDNAVVADYIRWRISLGHFPYVVEDVRPLMIRIGDQEFPAKFLDDDGQRALAKLMASGAEVDTLVVQGASSE